MIYTIYNDVAVLSVDTHACEICSFKRRDKDIDYMWRGDPEYWSGRNPTLFPHVSSPNNKILNFKGQDYKVTNHGFCRKSEFNFVEQGSDYLIFELRDNEETLKEYPYHFIMRVTGCGISKIGALGCKKLIYGIIFTLEVCLQDILKIGRASCRERV